LAAQLLRTLTAPAAPRLDATPSSAAPPGPFTPPSSTPVARRPHTGKKPPNRTPPGPGDHWEKGQELRKGGKASAPKNFGTMSGRRTLAPGEDLAGGTRIDPEGMVYAIDEGGGAYFCDRFRRYRFETQASGLALLRGMVSFLYLELDSSYCLKKTSCAAVWLPLRPHFLYTLSSVLGFLWCASVAC